MKPTISIIVPFFNSENTLERCIDSILSQKLEDFELVLVNDGSTDNSAQICQRYVELDNRVKLINQINSGAGYARNVGVINSNGSYIGFVDSDDYIEPNMYQLMLYHLLKSDADISVCARFEEYPNRIVTKHETRQQVILNRKESVEKLLKLTEIDCSVCDKLFKKSLFDNVEFSNAKIAEDIVVLFSLFLKIQKLVHIGVPLYHYCHRVESRSKPVFSEKNLELIDVSKDVHELIVKKMPSLKRQAKVFFLINLINLFVSLRMSNLDNTSLRQFPKLQRQIKSNFYLIFIKLDLPLKYKLLFLISLVKLRKVYYKYVAKS